MDYRRKAAMKTSTRLDLVTILLTAAVLAGCQTMQYNLAKI